MDPDEAIFEVEEAMTKCVDYLIHEFAGVRTGKASPALIENLDVHVQAYGGVSKLKSLAVISSPEPRMLMVQPFDPATTRDIERAIRECKLGLNPAAADRSIRVPIPELSEERRRDMVKTDQTTRRGSQSPPPRRPQGRHGHRQENEGRQFHHRGRPEGFRKGSPGPHQQIHQEDRRTRRRQGSGFDESVG